MSRATVGVIGHVDHGKTALVRALTGQETDRLPEERRRGISIALGFAHLGDTVDLIDMPGHERFVRMMIAGATGIDAVLLVVAANEGVRPQTIEHVEIAGLLGIGQALVAVTKCDLVDDAEAGLVAEEAVELLARNGLALAAPPVLASVPGGQGIAALAEALLALPQGVEQRGGAGPPWLPIDRVFAVPGHGPVVTGTLRGGALVTGDTVELLPARTALKVRGMQVHGAAVDAAAPGQRVAVNLRGAELGQLARGMALAAPASLDPAEWLTVSLHAVPGAPEMKNGARLRVLFGTQEVEARLRLLERDSLAPGDACLAQLRLAVPAAIPAREHVVLRRASPARTLAGGIVLDPAARRLRRHDGEVLHWLEALRDASPEEVVRAAVARAGVAGTKVADLARVSGLAPARVGELLADFPVTFGRTGTVTAMDAARPRLAVRTDPERQRLDEARAEELAGVLRAAGLTPPLPAEIVVDAASHRAVERLLRDGLAVRAVDRDKGRELLFHRDAIALARRCLGPRLAGGERLTVSEIAALLGVSRKFCMPLLDHLDTVRFTRREGVVRVAGPALRTHG